MDQGTITKDMNSSAIHIEYKSPIAALLWSFALPGFGQIYNGEVLIGVIFMILELGTNVISNLNLAIFETFHGDFDKAHSVINYNWGMFYPSVWAFSMWQAYNKAKMINCKLDNKQFRKSEYTGFFIGAVIGMNFGVYWHLPDFHNGGFFGFLQSPVFFGLILGLCFGYIGHLTEKSVNRKTKKKYRSKRH